MFAGAWAFRALNTNIDAEITREHQVEVNEAKLYYCCAMTVSDYDYTSSIDVPWAHGSVKGSGSTGNFNFVVCLYLKVKETN